MTSTYLQITGLDPIVARDGRPFGGGAGNRMRGLPWPLPSAVAGSARRALVIQQPDGQFDANTVDRLLTLEVAGLFPVAADILYLPAPKNCVWYLDKKHNINRLYRAIPMPLGAGSGCDLPDDLSPVMLEDPPNEDFKPQQLPAWWPVHELARWMTGQTVCFEDKLFLSAARSDDRTCVCIDRATRTAEESKLFTVSDLTISHLRSTGRDHSLSTPCPITLSCRVTDSDLTRTLNLYHPLGGNRRLAHWTTAPDQRELWKCPEPVREKLKETTRVCLMLTTPAIFRNGHLPGWLRNNIGNPPGASGVTLRLVGILNERWKALARISMHWRKPGPLRLHRMVPAGSMYFFEVQSGNPASLVDLWLQSVSDNEQDQRDGFGLAIWGTW